MSHRHRKLAQSFRDRPVPIKSQFRVRTDWFRTFTWRERFQILFGYNLLVMVGIAVQHNPGRQQPFVIGRITDKTKPDQIMQDQMEQLLAENPNLHTTALEK